MVQPIIGSLDDLKQEVWRWSTVKICLMFVMKASLSLSHINQGLVPMEPLSQRGFLEQKHYLESHELANPAKDSARVEHLR